MTKLMHVGMSPMECLEYFEEMKDGRREYAYGQLDYVMRISKQEQMERLWAYVMHRLHLDKVVTKDTRDIDLLLRIAKAGEGYGAYAQWGGPYGIEGYES